MTIYYLMIKTHKKTGLNYLCQTTRKDYSAYQGSGIHWKRHIKKHGYEVDTVVIQRCYTKTALASWGLFYSNLWSVVDSNKWANLKPEEGDGFASGKHNPMKQSAIQKKHRTAINDPIVKVKHQKSVTATWKDPIIRKKRIDSFVLNAGDSTGTNNNYADKKSYTFIHDTGIIEQMAQYDFRKKYNLCQQSVNKLINKHKPWYKGWVIKN